jgi:O-methyltransferase
MEAPRERTAVDLYLDLLAKALTRALYEDNDEILGLGNDFGAGPWKRRLGGAVASVLRTANLELVKKRPYDAVARESGRDWPARAETMVGLRRLENARFCIESVIDDDVPGDLLEAGVWRGGTSIFMRGVLKAHGVTDRLVWCADSFTGLPPPSPQRYPADAGLHLEGYEILAVDVEQVRCNFVRYGLLDDQVRFLVGWFKDTLPGAPVETLSVLRLDGDLYESTMQALDALYPRLSVGGYCIVDDYGTIDACRQAVHDYRRSRRIADAIVDVDGWCAYWRRTS